MVARALDLPVILMLHSLANRVLGFDLLLVLCRFCQSKTFLWSWDVALYDCSTCLLAVCDRRKLPGPVDDLEKEELYARFVRLGNMHPL